MSGWTVPTSFSDPDSAWSNEANAYDGNTGTFATTTSNNHWLELTFPATWANTDIIAIWCSRYKYTPPTGYSNLQVAIELWYDGSWNAFYTGGLSKSQWVEKILNPREDVSKLRIKVTNVGFPYVAYLHEVKIGRTPMGATLYAPVNGASGVQLTDGTLEFLDPFQYAETHDIHISEDVDPAFWKTIAGGEGFIVLDFPTFLKYRTSYYWKIRSTNDVGTTDYTGIWSFTLEIGKLCVTIVALSSPVVVATKHNYAAVLAKSSYNTALVKRNYDVVAVRDGYGVGVVNVPCT